MKVCGVSVSFRFNVDGERSNAGFCSCSDFVACDHSSLTDITGKLLPDGNLELLYRQCAQCAVLLGVNEDERRCTCGHAEVLHDDEE
jgi:hypothetical protein